MKILTVIVLILVIIVLTGIYVMTNAKTETQKYEVVFSKDNFEIRFYPEAILATVQMNGSYDISRNSGFSLLAGYIFGGNSENTKIAMTSPVRVTTGSNSSTMSFVMPSELGFEKLPNPNDPNIILQKSKPMYTASLRFGGYANDAEIEKHKEKLTDILKQLHIQHTNQFEFLGYNPPFQPVNRRNEVQVQLLDFKPVLFQEEVRNN